MQEQINQLNKQVQDLTKQVADLSSMLQITTMPFNLKEIIRNEVIKDVDTLTGITRTIEIPAGGTTITVPVNPVSILTFNYRGRDYKVPYIA